MEDDDLYDLRTSIFSRWNEIDGKLTEMDYYFANNSPTEWQIQALKTIQGLFINVLNILNNFEEQRDNAC